MALLKQEFNYFHALADLLSVITITLCLVLKVPQILHLVKVKNAYGMNLFGLSLELTSYTITFSYNYRNGYALLSYMEYPIILIQQILLIFLVIYYKGKLGIKSLIVAAIYFLFAFGSLGGQIPREFLAFCLPLCTPIGASSKVVHLYEIFRTKNSDSVSVMTWFLSAFTNMTRIYTVYMDSADAALLLNFSINLFLSSSIMFVARYFKSPYKKKDILNKNEAEKDEIKED